MTLISNWTRNFYHQKIKAPNGRYDYFRLLFNVHVEL